MRIHSSSGIVLIAGLVLLGGTSALGADEAPGPGFPERYTGIVMVTDAPVGVGNAVRIKVTLDRLSTAAERNQLIAAIRSGGSDALAEAMEKLTVGYVQLDQNMRYPLAYAIKIAGKDGEVIRVATNRRMSYNENTQGFVSKEYRIGIVELMIPAQGPGKGALIAAAKVDFNEQGQLEVRTLPNNTGAQTIGEVVLEKDKKKEKEKAAEKPQ